MSGNRQYTEQSTDSRDLQIARLAFIGASIVTLGDGISAIAAALTLEDLEKSSNSGARKTDTQLKQIEGVQKQIDYLINELNHMKKMMN